jgi:hypothetical protein
LRWLESSDRKIRGARVDSCCVASSRPGPTVIGRVDCSVGRWIRGGGVGCCLGGAGDCATPRAPSRVVSASQPEGVGDADWIRLSPLSAVCGRRCTKRAVMTATARMHRASPLSTTSNVLVICWARLFPYTGLPASAGVPAIRGDKAMPRTMRETPSTRRTPHRDEITATGRAC